MIKEFTQVALTTDLPDFHLLLGDVGTVVDITPNGMQVTIEFFNFDGDTMAVVPVSIDHVRPLDQQEIPHTRKMQMAAD